jgi:hypothetical protein
MSIEALGRNRQVTCDGCPAAYPNTYDADDFDIMIDDAKTAGWHITRRGGKWLHFCQGCARNQIRGSLL